MSKTKILAALAIFAVTVATFCGFSLSMPTFASESGGSEDGGPTGGNCSSGSGRTWNSCYGVIWYEYEADDDSIIIPTAGNASGGEIENCLSAGGSYLRLGYIVYDRRTGQPDSSGRYGVQAGLVPAGMVTPTYGGTGIHNYNYDAMRNDPRAYSWDKAQEAFNRAVDQGYNYCSSWDSSSPFCFKPDTPPPPQEDPPEGSTGGWTADVEVTISGRDRAPGHTIKSEKDMAAVMAVSADNTFSVKFVHTFYFEPPDIAWDTYEEDTEVPPSCVDYKITTEGIGAGPPREGTFCADTKGGAATFSVTVEAQLSPGLDSRNWASSRNEYGNFTGEKNHGKSFSYPPILPWPRHAIPHGCGDGEDDVPCTGTHIYKDIYDAIGAGSGQAEGAVSAIKPSDPTGYVQVGTNLPYIFAGETTPIAWNVSARGWHERRIGSTQSPVYQVSALSGSASSFESQSRGYGTTPRQYQESQQGGMTNFAEDLTDNYRNFSRGATSIVTSSPASDIFQVPDNTGDKLCSTYGYEWVYYWAYATNLAVGSRPVGDGLPNWAPEGVSYWFTFAASCRTIVKKPTIALWNGGLLTNGGVNVSIANRHVPRSAFGLAGATRNLFGSWTEYLGVIGKGANNFGTGAKYARYGTTGDTSPLTIANRGTLGNSGITTSNTYRTRLNTYIRNYASSNLDEMYNRSASDNSTKITVLSDPSGTNRITRNIEVNGSYDSVYQLPQNVIFVDGNLDIDPSVTRIDAWLIVNGELNTCPDFVANRTTAQGGTETAPGRNTICDKQLIFNGPVLAETLKLNRSYGADPVTYGSASSQYTPSEIFNLSADSYLWAYAQAGRYGSSYTESYSRELAPRY